MRRGGILLTLVFELDLVFLLEEWVYGGSGCMEGAGEIEFIVERDKRVGWSLAAEKRRVAMWPPARTSLLLLSDEPMTA